MYWWGIPLALALFAAIGAAVRNWTGASASLILLADWAACTGVVYITHDDYPVLFFMAADYLAAMAIFATRRTQWQSVIMITYGAQLICHAAYSLSNKGYDAAYLSYWALTYMAWFQVALIGGWIGTELFSRGRDSAFSGSGRDPSGTSMARRAED